MTTTKLAPPFCEECGEDIDLTVDPGARDAPIAWCEVCKPRPASVTISLHAPGAYTFGELMDLAGYSCKYWASRMSTRLGPGAPFRPLTCQDDVSPRSGVTVCNTHCSITVASRTAVVVVTPQRVAEAVLELFVAGDSGSGIRDIVRLRSFNAPGEARYLVVDCADEAARILQQACFGKIIYG